MGLIRTLFVCALGFVAGCGGCDSCFGAPGAGDDASFATQPTVAPRAVVDAAPEREEDAAADAGREAATDASSAVPFDAAPIGIARPKAPMPLGEFQVCGVYDGPLCEKACKKGNCRQECDGVGCTLACAGGYCSQLCGPSGKCKLSCPGGHCIQVCTKPEDCTKDCAGGSCE